MVRSPGTWRRLKIAVEVRAGHRVPPALPDPELVRLLGLLAGIRDGAGPATVMDEAEQSRRGEAERDGMEGSALRAACERLAEETDVRAFL